MRQVGVIIAAVGALLTADAALAESPESSVRIPIARVSNNAVVQVLVEPGDHIWKISARHLASLGVDVEVGAYWRKVIAENLDDLRSGDPDLIYPGEVLTMPELP